MKLKGYHYLSILTGIMSLSGLILLTPDIDHYKIIVWILIIALFLSVSVWVVDK